MTIIEHGSRNPAESEGNESPFWHAAIDILQEHRTEVLKGQVLDLAEEATDVDAIKINTLIRVLEEKYIGKFRKFTNEAEINHAYQVALLTALAIGPQNLHHDTLAVVLAHDLYENTAMTAEEIITLTSPRMYKGIDALSHQNNHQDIYPDQKDKRQYFRELQEAERKDPDLHILTIKAMDQIAVSNGPVTKDELKSKGRSLRRKWNRMTRKKIGEMNLLRSMLSPQESAREAKVKQILTGGIDYAQQRLDSTLGKRIMKRFSNLPLRRHRVK